MKRSIIFPFLVGFFSVFAQTSEYKWNIGLHLGTSQYSGDLANDILNFNQKSLQNNTVGGISVSRFLSPSFDLNFLGNLGAVGYYQGNTTFKQEILNLNGQLRYKLANGYILEEKSLFRPFVFAGFGMERYKPLNGSGTGTNIEPSGNGGLGVSMMLSDRLSLYYQAGYYYMFSDSRDTKTFGEFNDGYLLHSVGLAFSLGQPTDADRDGIPDKKDACAGTPEGAKVDPKGCPLDSDADGVPDYLDKCPSATGISALAGCPDADKDGIADAEDQCPDVPGIAEMKGCPDTDGDGITDSKDKCPNVKGVLAFEGCPDSDNDGIKDEEDLCPNMAGVKEFKGCPDTDLDGIKDSEDQCPDKKGPASTKGCPDTDNDGVHDGIDRCPTLAGVSDNQGCPAIKPEITQLFTKALQGIQFETGKAVIKKNSNGILNAVVKVMLENPTYNLSISGHTDDVGDDVKNMTLSKDRADAVAKYLIEHGVDPTRITTFGYGESKPVDTNLTASGRTRNRRVELRVEFKQ